MEFATGKVAWKNRGRGQRLADLRGWAIQSEYLLLKRAQIYGAIAFYLDRQVDIDECLERSEREFEADSIPMEQANPDGAGKPRGLEEAAARTLENG